MPGVTLTKELPRAGFVALVTEGEKVVAVAAIKRPRPDYALDKAKSSGFKFSTKMCEFGYVAVTKAQQGKGLSGKMSAKLLKAFGSGPLFATTSNERMKLTLAHAGFEPKGGEWSGVRGNRLSLWIRNVQKRREKSQVRGRSD